MIHRHAVIKYLTLLVLWRQFDFWLHREPCDYRYRQPSNYRLDHVFNFGLKQLASVYTSQTERGYYLLNVNGNFTDAFSA